MYKLLPFINKMFGELVSLHNPVEVLVMVFLLLLRVCSIAQCKALGENDA